MKIVAPPQITGLDELIDVIVHPDKLLKTLQQLADMRDAVKANCDILNTKSEADDYLAQAQTASNRANETLQQAESVKQKAQAFADEMKQDFLVSQATYKEREEAQIAKSKDLQFMEYGLNERANLLTLRADELDAREQALTDATAALMRKQAALDDEVNKMKQRIALFSDLH